MKNTSYTIIFLMVVALWTSNIFLLNTISKKEKEYSDKMKVYQETQKRYEEIVLQYDSIVDLEKIKDEMLKKGFKQTRDIIYFKVEKNNSLEKQD